MQLTHRPRRLRRNPSVRSLVRENHLTTDDFIYPMFVMEGENNRVA
jgi:porphobilinogen synthase